MARLAMTAKEQLRRAHELGHDFTVEQRGPWPEHDDPHPKFYLHCSCGWKGKGAMRSKKGASGLLIRHMISVQQQWDEHQHERPADSPTVEPPARGHVGAESLGAP